MRLFLFVLLLVASRPVLAQLASDWTRLRQYAHAIGVDSLCPNPDAACLSSYFTQIVYGRTPRHMGYQGGQQRIDTARIHRLTQQFLAGSDWCPLLDSLESNDAHYRQLMAYCMRCLVDDYMADSLTLEQVRETLNAYRWLNRFPQVQRVLVNIPSATLRVINSSGQTLLTSRVIVGKASTPTPTFTAMLPALVLNPYWNIPRSIVQNELLPKIRRNPVATLDILKLQVINAKGQLVDPATVDWWARTFPYRLRQSTGCDNALGVLKFNLSSPYDVYLHDTNARRLFALPNRYLSHGCIRVEKPVELANLLLGQHRLSKEFLDRCPVNAQPQMITLPQPVPVIILYNILDINEQGAIEVFRDVYGWRHLSL